MSVKFDVWESDDGLLRMTEFDPVYFRAEVSTEVKDQAKDKGLIYFNRDRWTVVLTEAPADCALLLEVFGLEGYLEYRLANGGGN